MDNEYYDQRQHLNLSRRAYDTVQSDKFDFLSRPSRAGMLNLIFASYCTDADAAIDCALARYRSDLEQQLSRISAGEEKDRLISALVDARCGELAERANGHPKEQQFKFQLNRDNYEYIRTWRDEHGYYDGTPGQFIKAVIEEYAALPFFRREEIILRDRISLLSGCIDRRCFLHIKTRTSAGSQRYEVKPYMLCADSGNTYHYLVGLSKPHNSDEPARPAAFRISRIEKITTSSAKSGRLTAAEKKLIDARLKDTGVQFMLFEPELIKVRLTKSGQRLLEQTLSLRPSFVKAAEGEKGDIIYECQCTALQARYYFFKFGAEAEILFPPSLRDEFYAGYKAAVEVYESGEEDRK